VSLAGAGSVVGERLMLGVSRYFARKTRGVGARVVSAEDSLRPRGTVEIVSETCASLVSAHRETMESRVQAVRRGRADGYYGCYRADVIRRGFADDKSRETRVVLLGRGSCDGFGGSTGEEFVSQAVWWRFLRIHVVLYGKNSMCQVCLR